MGHSNNIYKYNKVTGILTWAFNNGYTTALVAYEHKYWIWVVFYNDRYKVLTESGTPHPITITPCKLTK